MVSIHNIENVEYEARENVGVWQITDFSAYFQSEENVKKSEEHFRKEATKDEIDGTVVVIQNAEELGSDMRETLDHINEEWSELANEISIDRLAYVADGMMANTVKMNVKSDTDTESFDSVDEAVDWCQQA